jgi:hypothetical protein
MHRALFNLQLILISASFPHARASFAGSMTCIPHEDKDWEQTLMRRSRGPQHCSIAHRSGLKPCHAVQAVATC